ncbi:cytochrome c-type biogenesis protein CcmH [Pseudooceanicola sp. CBS1P-1]|uniref:Cytochrome c-type biogenesis protein n=1 Tax=Pseudooceanicola albus TaxID=2692189 RepID=A0A6L7GAS9_9RHOB|nr:MULTISPECIES: cytochrome c-type biogenesis protein [Pseudooceanicola]MBT9384461.1 cytochrome c-type biogenesis protein CcmH [Pseudooceanicola endophyticus]MXN20638.1 cytochrome C biogenesis protein CcdA [Pseudooceanicola albus]
MKILLGGQLAALLLVLLVPPAFAVQPGEMLSDPNLEARARDISAGLRCLVCRNENIDDSNADLAHDLRVLVRDRLKAGDTNQQVVNYIVDRYGEYVLLKPPMKGANWLLWGAGPVMLLAGLGIGAVFIRRRARTPEEAQPLSAEESARLDDILKG